MGKLYAERAVAEGVRAEVGYPDVVIDNAGIIRSSMFCEHDPVRDGVTPRISSLRFGPTSEERQLRFGRTLYRSSFARSATWASLCTAVMR